MSTTHADHLRADHCLTAAVQSVDVVIPVYRDASNLKAILEGIRSQVLPTNFDVRVIVVDDASHDGTCEFIERTCIHLINDLIKLEANSGPSVARNIGCLHGKGAYVVTLDSDCVPMDPNFLLEHWRMLQKFDVSCGSLTVADPQRDFWCMYQEEVFRSRVKRCQESAPIWFTTANLAFTREHFETIGGFDSRFVFGFEDRDFLVRSYNAGASIQYCERAVALHEDVLSLVSVCSKLEKSAQREAAIFSKAHPEVYCKSPYSRVDAREYRILKLFGLYGAPLFLVLTERIDRILQIKAIPYFAKKTLVKIFTALSFVRGSSLS